MHKARKISPSLQSVTYSPQQSLQSPDKQSAAPTRGDEFAPSLVARGLNSQHLSWDEAVNDYLLQMKGTLEEKTVAFYASRLKMLTKWAQDDKQLVALEQFKARHLRVYLAERAQHGVSDVTRRHDAVAARAFLKFCTREGYISANPLAGYEVAKPARSYVKCPTDDEVSQLLKSLVDRWRPSVNPDVRFIGPKARLFFGRRNYAIVAGLVETACRVGELLCLTLDDYQPKEQQIVIREAKGDEPRIVPIGDAWIGAVEAYLRIRPRVASNLLFINEFGNAISVDSFGKRFRGYMKYAGLSGFSLHGLRHYAITKLAEVDVWAASQIAGHKDLKVTRLYLHSNLHHLKQVHAQAAPLSRIVSSRNPSTRRRIV